MIKVMIQYPQEPWTQGLQQQWGANLDSTKQHVFAFIS